MHKTLVNLESPYAGNIEHNTIYAQLCMRDSIINHNEAPFASHLLYTQPNILCDANPQERILGIKTGLEFTQATSKTVVYTDLGITPGMENAIDAANRNGVELEMRKLSKNYWEKYIHKTLRKTPYAPPGTVRREGEQPAPPEMPPNRIINENVFFGISPWITLIPIFVLLIIALILWGSSLGWWS